MGLWGQGNSIEVRCWVSNFYYQMGVMKKLSVWKPNKISTQFYPRTFKERKGVINNGYSLNKLGEDSVQK
jgi:hypothetical protein